MHHLRLPKYRIFMLLLSLIAVVVLWLGRLFWIQLAAPRSFSAHGVDLIGNSVLQREKGVVLDSGRGDFYDKNGIPLTGETIRVLIAFPVGGAYQGSAEQIGQLARLLGVTVQAWKQFAGAIDAPKIWSADSGEPVRFGSELAEQIEKLNVPGVKLADYKLRYGGEELARHAIGFISQDPERVTRQYADQFHKGELQLTSKIGGAGLEKTLEPWLRGLGPTSITYFTDAGKRPLEGLDARVIEPASAYYPLKMMTTLDAAVQRRIEAAMEKLGVKEANVVVLDAANGDVVAEASRPLFDPRHIDLSSGAWSDKAVKAIAPGSIFKTIVAAAALEEKVAAADESFDCEGAYGKYGFTCWKKEGHGRLTLREAFAESCNIVFGKLAQRLSAAQLESYAHKLGLGNPVGWHGDVDELDDWTQWDGEEGGQLFAAATPKTDEGVLMQTAIGQRDVRVTPLQAANLVATLLHHGEVLSPRIVKEIRYRNDRVLESFPAHLVSDKKNGISRKTADELLHWMSDVIDYGTGTSLQGAVWRLAGKSGTAQIGQSNNAASAALNENQWFIGYGPVQQPLYAVSVVVQNVRPGGANQSLPLFKEVMNILATQ